LAISYQIVVDRHHGHLSCDSTPGQGTTFHIQIPLHPPKTSASTPERLPLPLGQPA
jgi:signal transduction histidine kinase